MKRDRRKTARHNRAPAAIGSIRTRRKNGKRVRFIKVQHGGGPHERWTPYARWLWERHNGPVPAGKRVAHLDGDTLNDSLANLRPVGPADVVFLAHERDPEMSAANYRKLCEATAKCNRLRARVNRELNWLPTRWYAVFAERGIAINDPHRSRRSLLKRYAGISIPLNGRCSAAIPFDVVRGCDIVAQFGNRLRKVDPAVSEELLRDALVA